MTYKLGAFLDRLTPEIRNTNISGVIVVYWDADMECYSILRQNFSHDESKSVFRYLGEVDTEVNAHPIAGMH